MWADGKLVLSSLEDEVEDAVVVRALCVCYIPGTAVPADELLEDLFL